MTPLPAGYEVRPATLADIEAGQRLLDEIETAECGEPRRHDNRLEVDFADPHVDLERGAWLVSAAPGAAAPLAGLAFVWRPRASGEILVDHYVHPDHVGRGVSDVLLDRIEERAAELTATLPSDSPAAVLVWAGPGTEGHRRMLARGYTAVRQSYEMRIDLRAEPPAPVWPAGIEARPLRRDCDEPAVYAADQDAFAEHFMFEAKPIEDWRRRFLDQPGIDPDLWLVAWDGPEVAGYASGSAADDGGMVNGLAVRKPWRRRGLGRALLTAQLRTFARRGVTPVRLYVDAQNATGAVALYERVGMRVERRFDVLSKAVR
jgi:mycothiol synthase